MKSRSTSSSPAQNQNLSYEKEIQRIQRFMQNYLQVQSEGNLQRIMDLFAPDAIVYDMMPPLMFNGREIYRKAVESYYTKSFAFPIENSWEDLQVTLNGDTAFCHGLYHMRGQFKDNGEEMEYWLRTTMCLVRDKGQWLISHLHNSVPAADDGRALMDLDPASSFFH